MPEFQTLLYDEQDGVAWVTLEPPRGAQRLQRRRCSASSTTLWRGLRRNDDVRVAVLTGRRRARPSAPASTAPKRWASRRRPRPAQPVRAVGSASTPFMFDDPGANIGPKSCDLWKPVIAAVNGMACGGAFYMLGEVEFIIAAEHATFFDPHVTYGMTAAFEPMHMLQKMPFHEIMRMSLLGNHERLSAKRAHEIGLVSEVVPADQLRDGGAVGGGCHRLGAAAGDPGNAARHLGGARAVALAGAVAGLRLHRAGHQSRIDPARPGGLRVGQAREVEAALKGRAQTCATAIARRAGTGQSHATKQRRRCAAVRSEEFAVVAARRGC